MERKPSAKRPRIGAPKPTRSKLDPRLAYLLSLSEQKRASLGKRAEESVRFAADGRRRRPGSARSESESSRAGKARSIAPVTSGLHLPDPKTRPSREHGLKEPYASAFVLSDASAADLERLGVRVRSQSGDVFTAFIPLSLIPKLERSQAVRYIELARPLEPALDEAVVNSQISTLQAAPSSLSGQGVVVGIVDSTLDVHHPDFRTAGGNSRVLFLWDQLLAPQGTEAGPPTGGALPGFTPVGGATYGVEYSQATINAELNRPAGTPAYQTVRHGLNGAGTAGLTSAHGTHVAGIAAGNGLAQANQQFVGAAPQAGIIFVAANGGPDEALAGDSAGHADAFAYIFARAAQLGLPCVVNMSRSDNQGPHDGLTLGEQFLDGLLLVPGRVIALSAGNSNNTGSHAGGTIAQGGTVNVVLTYQQADVDCDGIIDSPVDDDDVEIWYDGHDRLSITITAPDGTVIGPVAPGSSQNGALTDGTQVQITSVLDDPRNGDNLISVLILPPGNQQITLGNWTFALTGTTIVNGRFDAWVDRNNRGMSSWQAPLLQEGQTTLGVPATARRVITVGNTDKTTPTPAIAGSSGRGPTRDGRIKPEIATVGSQISAARSRNMLAANPGNLYATKSGTSMSSPLVAGAAALLLECRGAAATWANIKQILTDTAGTAGVAVPGSAFGYGFLQTANACAAPAENVDVWLRDANDDTGVEPYTGSVMWQSPDIEVLDAAGSPATNPTHDPNSRFANIIRVTVRNRGVQTARNVEVFLYWADPATNLPFPSAWSDEGIYTGAPGFASQGNVIVIPQLAAGASATVDYAWAPPAPGSNIRGDDHFCLLARIEAEQDLSGVGAGGWSVIRNDNNIALRNVHVQVLSADGDADTAFYVEGTEDQDTLIIEDEQIRGLIEIVVPTIALPWRDLDLIDKLGPRPRCYDRRQKDPLARMTVTLKGEEITQYTDVTGAEQLEVDGGVAVFRAPAGGRIVMPDVRVATGVRMPVGLRVREGDIGRSSGLIHVGQLSGGRRTGGITLEVRGRSKARPKR